MTANTTQAYRIETVITEDGLLKLHGPFRAGDSVEVIVLNRPTESDSKNRYPLRGLPLRYDRPFNPVAEEDWDATQ